MTGNIPAWRMSLGRYRKRSELYKATIVLIKHSGACRCPQHRAEVNIDMASKRNPQHYQRVKAHRFSLNHGLNAGLRIMGFRADQKALTSEQ